MHCARGVPVGADGVAVDVDHAAVAWFQVGDRLGPEPGDAVLDEPLADVHVLLDQLLDRLRIAGAGRVEHLEPGVVAPGDQVGQDLCGRRAVGQPPLLEPGGDEGAGHARRSADVGDVVHGRVVLRRPAVLEGLDIEVLPRPTLELAPLAGPHLAVPGRMVLADHDQTPPVAVDPRSGGAGR